MSPDFAFFAGLALGVVVGLALGVAGLVALMRCSATVQEMILPRAGGGNGPPRPR